MLFYTKLQFFVHFGSVIGACGETKDAANPISRSTECQNALMSAIAYCISMILFHIASRHFDFQRLNWLGAYIYLEVLTF